MELWRNIGSLDMTLISRYVCFLIPSLVSLMGIVCDHRIPGEYCRHLAAGVRLFEGKWFLEIVISIPSMHFSNCWPVIKLPSDHLCQIHFETIGLKTISGHQFFEKTHDGWGVHDFVKIWAILLTILNKRSAPAVLAAVKAARSKYATTKVTVVGRSLSKSWSDSVFPLVLIAVYLQEVLLLWFPQPSYLWTYRRVLCLKRSLMGVHA